PRTTQRLIGAYVQLPAEMFDAPFDSLCFVGDVGQLAADRAHRAPKIGIVLEQVDRALDFLQLIDRRRQALTRLGLRLTGRSSRRGPARLVSDELFEGEVWILLLGYFVLLEIGGRALLQTLLEPHEVFQRLAFVARLLLPDLPFLDDRRHAGAAGRANLR